MHEDFTKKYNNLNIDQKKAVDSIEGPVLVIAGPGSGKTELLSVRVANILLQTDVNPNNILCLTFTESAAINMRQRLFKLIGKEAYNVAIHTFHSFCLDIINTYPEYFYNGAYFVAADPLSQIEILENIFSNLDYDNPLNSYHPKEGYVYLYDVQNAISLLKKAGISPLEFNKIVHHNKDLMSKVAKQINEVFSERLSKKIFSKITKLLEDINNVEHEAFPVVHFKPILPIIIKSLQKALDSAILADKTAPIREWKSKYLKKSQEGEIVIKDFYYIKHLKALSEIYSKYTDTLEEEGLIDFEDMILQVILALEKNQTLKYELAEQYLYFLIDEFQDTNDAQMRLIKLLTDAKEYEGRPNIMVVGDDDQAIYKFQGAEISNILNYKATYKEPTVVTLKNNYRSTQEILDLAKKIIRKGEDRLENIINEIDKDLIASNFNILKGNISMEVLNNKESEYFWLVNKIKDLVEQNQIQYQDIAVIARKHSQLEELALFFNKLEIPINYERQQDVLIQPHIRQIITIASFVVTLNRKKNEIADELVPEILSYPFWELKREDIWGISKEANKNRELWFNCMKSSTNQKINNIAKFLEDLSLISHYEPLEYVLDYIIGGDIVPKDTNDKIKSPFKKYYFNKEKFDKSKSNYLNFLTSLQTFHNALKEYKKGKDLLLEDLINFVNVHKKNNLPLMSNTLLGNSENAVNLLTAHKAKGLEFNTVFVLSCNDDNWASRRNNVKKIPMPNNLPITPAGDNLDDQLRLFFVALTRAKSNLFLSSYKYDDKGKEKQILNFIDCDALEYNDSSADHEKNNNDVKDSQKIEILEYAWDTYNTPPIYEKEKDLLNNLLENYQMSVTHLNNYLNVTKNGPLVFLEQNLLRFPQAKIPAGAYGTAIHKAIQLLYLSFKNNKKIPTLDFFLNVFTKSLQEQRLPKNEYDLYYKKGIDSLTCYYNTQHNNFNITDKIEFDFKDQGIIIGQAKITGKIDKLVFLPDNEITVHDFKSGKIKNSWVGKTANDKVTLLNYKRQLIFYKILVENSRIYNKKFNVNQGILEFITPNEKNEITFLEYNITNDDVSRLQKLIDIVYNKIINLDFVDVSHYSQDYKGIMQFEEDLLNNKI